MKALLQCLPVASALVLCGCPQTDSTNTNDAPANVGSAGSESSGAAASEAAPFSPILDAILSDIPSEYLPRPTDTQTDRELATFWVEENMDLERKTYTASLPIESVLRFEDRIRVSFDRYAGQADDFAISCSATYDDLKLEFDIRGDAVIWLPKSRYPEMLALRDSGDHVPIRFKIQSIAFALPSLEDGELYGADVYIITADRGWSLIE